MTKLDIGIILAYLVVMLAVGYIAKRKQKGIDDYYVAGRQRKTFSITCLWLCSWIGGSTIVGGTKISYEMGIAGCIVPLAICVGLLVYGLFFASKINALGKTRKYYTYSEMISDRYDQRSGNIATVTTILSYIAFTASQLTAISSILTVLTGLNKGISFILGTAVVIIYTTLGGYLAVTFTDWIQFILIILGVIILGLPLSMMHISPGELIADIPSSYWDFSRYGSWQAILGVFISTSFSFFTLMDSYTRTYAARDGKTAVKGTLLTIGPTLLIGIATLYIGMAAKLTFPQLSDPSQAMPIMMMKLFPSGIRGLMLIGILSAIMSTADISILSPSSSFCNDIYKKYITPGASPKQQLHVGMVSSVVIGGFAAWLAWYMQDIIGIIYIAFTLASANLFFPTVCGFFWKRGSAKASYYSMLLSLAAVLLWYGARGIGLKGSIFQWDPVWPGLAVSGVVYFLVSLWDPRDAAEDRKIEDFILAKPKNDI